MQKAIKIGTRKNSFMRNYETLMLSKKKGRESMKENLKETLKNSIAVLLYVVNSIEQ